MKILLVDDSKSARYALRLQLQRHGVEVETADSAESALEMLKGDLPDAIMMDHMMPGLSGFEALEIIRSDGRTAHLPVVICTASEDPDFAAAAHRRGITGILPKSVAPEKLPEILALLKDVIARRAHPHRAPSPSAPSVPKAPAAVDLLRQIDSRLGPLVEERLQARWPTLIEPLLADLKRDLHERLLAETRQLIETRIVETRAALEALLVSERMATQARQDTITSELQSVNRLAEETLPDLVKVEVESERAQIMDLVEQYLREFAPPAAGAREPQREPAGDRPAALDAGIAAKAQEVARRTANDAVAAALNRTQQIADGVVEQVRASQVKVYVGILAAAMSGVLAAALVYLLLR